MITLNNIMTGLGKAFFGSNAVNKGREAFDNLKIARTNQQVPSFKQAPKFGLHNSKSFVSKQVGVANIS
ncbi:MAG: hypothetical protein OXU45_01305 [Candidatus Melainabacteria bacterium]|nr:hypothetical protein [Candidatus Melainabacteria bacterium]